MHERHHQPGAEVVKKHYESAFVRCANGRRWGNPAKCEAVLQLVGNGTRGAHFLRESIIRDLFARVSPPARRSDVGGLVSESDQASAITIKVNDNTKES